jgi:hypothetical protein
MSLSIEKYCQNCNTNLQGEYCHQCGQKSPQDRITLKLLFDLAINSIFDVDRGFFFTCKEILIHPDILISNYLAGKRITYTNPIKLLLVWLGIATLITFVVVDFDEIMAKSIDRQLQSQPTLPKLSPKKEEVTKIYKEEVLKVTSVFTHNQQLIYGMLIPFTAFLLGIFFRKQGYYFSEHLVFTTYSYAGYHILGSFLYLLYLIKSIDFYVISAISFVLLIGFMTYFAIKFYGQKENKWKAGIKASVAYIITYIVYSLLIAVSAGVYAYTKIALMK